MHTFSDRAARARVLAERFPPAHEILTFYAAVVDWQSEQAPVEGFDDLPSLLGSLVEVTRRNGPKELIDASVGLMEGFESLLADEWQAPGPPDRRAFFARGLLQVYASRLPEGLDCSWCSFGPQAGCLTTEGDGQALHLICGMCFRRHRAVRDRCPDCGERNDRKLVTFSTGEFPHLRVRACDSCQAYFLLVDLEKEIEAIPEVDEIAGVALTLWAAEAGYRRMLPNIVGI